MRVISIGSDRSVVAEGSPARARAEAYARRFGELRVVVFSLAKHGLKEVHKDGLHIYPTNSLLKLLYITDAARVARQLPGEVVTVQDPFEAGLAGVFGRRGRPLHVQLHTDPFSEGFARGLRNRARLLVMPLVLRRAARVRSVSVRVKEAVEKRYPRVPVSVLPIFVDVARFRSLLRAPHPRFSPALLWMGRMEREKDPQLALDTLRGVLKERPAAGLVMLGSGSLEAALRTHAGKIGDGERVEFPGWQDPTEFLRSADLLLVTSRYEGYGRQIVEALAASVPVLSTDVGIAAEAGAATASAKEFPAAAAALLGRQLRAVLRSYPYASVEEYTERYCADIAQALR